MFDIVSYIIGKKSSGGEVIIESGITCTDDGNGNITITTEE